MRFFVLAGLMTAALAAPIHADAGPVTAVATGATTAVVVTGKTAVKGTAAVGRTAVKGTGAVVGTTGRGLVCVATLFHRC
jgi:hypothetical protein